MFSSFCSFFAVPNAGVLLCYMDIFKEQQFADFREIRVTWFVLEEELNRIDPQHVIVFSFLLSPLLVIILVFLCDFPLCSVL